MSENTYEKERLERIRRNNEELITLGLPPMSATKKPATRTKSKSTKKSVSSKSISSVDVESFGERRMSSRLVNKRIDAPSPYIESKSDVFGSDSEEESSSEGEASDFNNDSSSDSESDESDEPSSDEPSSDESYSGGNTRRKRQRTRLNSEEEEEEEPPVVDTYTPISSRLISAEIDHKHWIGKEILPIEGNKMKQACMALLNQGIAPRFSNLSGIQQWENAIALFVNVNGNTYENMLDRKEGTMTWFASPSQHENTPVIRRILDEFGKKADNPDGVMLFCRLVGSPYIYCGRLSYMSHDASVRPMKFIWKMLDFAELVKSSSTSFEKMLIECRDSN